MTQPAGTFVVVRRCSNCRTDFCPETKIIGPFASSLGADVYADTLDGWTAVIPLEIPAVLA